VTSLSGPKMTSLSGVYSGHSSIRLLWNMLSSEGRTRVVGFGALSRHQAQPIIRREAPKIGIGGSLSAPPLLHHRAYGSVHGGSRDCANAFRPGLTEQFEVGVGKPNREGFAPCDVPGAAAASGRIEQFPRDSLCDQRCTTATWCFPLTPQSGPQSQPDPTSESDQHLGRFAKAEIAAPTPHIRDQFFHCRLGADAFGPRVISRIRRLNRSRDFGAIVRLVAGPAVKLSSFGGFRHNVRLERIARSRPRLRTMLRCRRC
jgi:hypothetical protein